MGLFDVETWIDFVNGVSLCFGVRSLKDLVWAHEQIVELRALQSTSPEYRAIAYGSIPEWLLRHVVNVKSQDNHTLPSDWRERLASMSGLLSGMDGIEIIGRVCFRSRLDSTGADSEGPEG